MEAQSKIVLITGGSRGLGKNMALRVAEKGMDVILTYHSARNEAEAGVQQIKDVGQKGVCLQLNTSDVKSFNNFFSSVKKVLTNEFKTEAFDVLVNNAGIGIHAPFAETSEEQFDQLMNIHFKGVYFLTQKALELLQDNGSIINISSGLARFAGPGYSAYASMKAAVENLTRYQAKELGDRKSE